MIETIKKECLYKCLEIMKQGYENTAVKFGMTEDNCPFRGRTRLPYHIFEDEYIFGALSNSLSIGGMQNLIGRDVALDDGLLEGLFIKKTQNVVELEQITRALLTRNFNCPSLHFAKSSRFEIDSQKTAWTLDGENGGEHEHVLVEAKKQALGIALPKIGD